MKYLPALLLLVMCSLHLTSQDKLYMSGVIYDHNPDNNPDFEWIIDTDYGIIENYLSEDRKPILKNPNVAKTVHSSTTFNQWFRNTPGVNIGFPNITIELSNQGQRDSRIYSFVDYDYFPIDNMGYGNYQNYGHNFHFCFETHSRFLYQGGEVFNFRGDDDVWVFINNQLAIDLGGVSSARTASLKLNDLDLVAGQYYPFDFFFCERHTVASEIQIEISLAIFCGYYDWCGVCEGDGQGCCDCDDNDPCTDSKCDTLTGACTHTPFCNDQDACTDNVCTISGGNVQCSYPAKSCSDGNLCTSDTCTPGTGVCVNTPKVCQDSSPCTIDSCNSQDGQCQFILNTCSDGELCTVDACNNATGQCSHTPKVCNDGQACTTDSCSSATGLCVYSAITCSDGNLCTTDSCNNATGCVYTPKVCNDNNACTTDSCSAADGQCVFTTITCNDGDKCTVDTCNSLTGCVYTPKVCTDSSVCTTDSCNPSTGNCQNIQPPGLCDDSLMCTTDSCNPVSGCLHVTKSCGDSNTCTTDSCDPLTGNCKNVLQQCDDTNACTSDSCVNGAGCKFVQKQCTDGLSCTTDTCNTVSGLCEFPPIPDCGPCTFVTCTPSGDPCNPNVCNPTTGICGIVPIVCDDGDACTLNSCVAENATDYTCHFQPKDCPTTDACNPASCSNGACITTPRVCFDGDSCTNDTCVAVDANDWECAYNPFHCPAADPCHPAVCSEGACIVSPIICNDGNSCTNDTCIPLTADTYKCDFAPVVCTAPDSCHTSTCVLGTCVPTLRTCYDGDLCTNDTCVVVNSTAWECNFAPVVCDPVDGCNPTVCSEGTCVVTPQVCWDGDSCTNDTCVSLNATAFECNFASVVCPYEDGCFPSICSDGTCVPTTYDCEDGDPCTLETCTSVNKTAVCTSVIDACDDNMACTNDFCIPFLGCSHSPVVCPETPCQVGVCDNSTGCGLLPRDCSNFTTNFCIDVACDNNVGCITFPKVCQVEDPKCHTATCNGEKQECVKHQRDSIECQINVTEAAVIGTGAIVGIVLAALAGLALAGFLGKKTFDWAVTGKDALGNVQDNPLYEGETMMENPLFEENL